MALGNLGQRLAARVAPDRKLSPFQPLCRQFISRQGADSYKADSCLARARIVVALLRPRHSSLMLVKRFGLLRETFSSAYST